MTLSAEQVSLIRSAVENGNVTLPSLKDDLIDHLCCAVEYRLNQGNSFDESLEFALFELAPKGLKEIQQETNVLLQTKTEINMKRVTYLTGLLTTMMMSLGWLLNILHLGYIGNRIFAFGALGFISLFLPLLAVHYFKTNSGKAWTEKMRVITGLLSVILIGLAFLAKIMHMPGADEVLWAGGLTFIFSFLPFLFFNLYKKSVSGR